MSLRDRWRAFVRRNVAAPATPEPVAAADVVAQPTRRSRVTRTLFEQSVNGRVLGRTTGIRVRARCIPECVEVVAANRGLEPREVPA